MSKPVKAAVFGTGSWGTAFGMVLADAGCDVVLWARRPGLVEAVNSTRTNPDYLPGVELPANLRATADAAEAARDADFTVLAIPSQTLRGNLAGWKPLLAPDTVLVSLMKGVELGSAMRMSEVIEDVAGVGADRIAVVTGPNLAREIAARMPPQPWSPAPTRPSPSGSRPPATRRTSARTPTPTSPAANWAAP